ncbi:hypothetical protein J1P26_17405 [Neobacillus sp. MM2021_6]|uniref:hypothetical protein n=1 Tax=Bacillaceae TaxID=186817 RepID=UPI0014078FD0|nr:MULTISPECIES: hypothetical protein [Bacillaceae]MBO0961486.1 hypothetical protein [Neobacillus sp. MM2021_6]NHC19590.1 hypothetical protein [Bacillus sp. MM2020_4]
MDITSCPHCHSDEGYYVKTQIKGLAEFRYKFDGSYDEEHNSDIHDSLTYTDGKYAYCRSCGKRLFKVND